MYSAAELLLFHLHGLILLENMHISQKVSSIMSQNTESQLRLIVQNCWQYPYEFADVHEDVTGIWCWSHSDDRDKDAVYRVLPGAASSYLLSQSHDCTLDINMVSRLKQNAYSCVPTSDEWIR